MKKSFGIAGRTASLFAVTVVVLLVLLGGANVYSLLQIVIPLTEDAVATTVRARGDELGRWFGGHVQELHRYASQTVIRSGELDEIQAYLAEQAQSLHPEARLLIYADWDGNHVTSDGSTIDDIQAQDYYIGIVRGARVSAVGAASISTEGSAPYVTVAHEVRGVDGRIRGIIAQTIESSTIDDVVAGIQPTRSSFAIVADLDSNVAAHPDQSKILSFNLRRSDEQGYDGLSDIGTRMMRGFSGVGQYRDPEGKSFYAVYSAIPETSGWGLVVVVPRAELMSQVYLIMVLVALSLVALIFSVMTLMHFISRTVVKPISELSNEMKTITRAMDFSRRVQIKRQDEIGQLGQSFNQMGEQLEESFLKIREYSENLEDMVAQRTEELNAANNELKEKNKTIEQEMFIAQRVQRNILPDQATTLLGDELRFAASYSSMEAIGGDLYDISRIGQTTFGFFIADVSGHGIPAALITMLAKVSFTTYSHWDIPTGETCTSVNDAIFRMIGDLDHYLTAYFGKLDLQTGIFEYTNCGHHPAMVIREKDGSIEELDTSGFLIGAFADGMYETKSIQLEEGDRILLFTDGIVEARNEDGDFFGNDRLYDYIKQNLDCVPGDFVDGLIGNVDAYCGSRPADDDRAVLYIQFLSTVDDPDNERKVADALIIEKKSTPGSASVQKKYQKGIDLLQENRLQEALDFFKSRLKKEPENPKLLNYLSATYYAKGDFPEAYRVLETMLELGHDTKAVRKNMEKVRQQLDSII